MYTCVSVDGLRWRVWYSKQNVLLLTKHTSPSERAGDVTKNSLLPSPGGVQDTGRPQMVKWLYLNNGPCIDALRDERRSRVWNLGPITFFSSICLLYLVPWVALVSSTVGLSVLLVWVYKNFDLWIFRIGNCPNCPVVRASARWAKRYRVLFLCLVIYTERQKKCYKI